LSPHICEPVIVEEVAVDSAVNLNGHTCRVQTCTGVRLLRPDGKGLV
jgi:hypothetical protein